jgi:hypothetical protein
MTGQLPNSNVPIADPQTGMVDGSWQAFFQGLTGKPSPEGIVQATGSPFVFRASVAGHLVVQGALVGLSMIRGRSAIPLSPTIAMIPLSQGDQAIMTYSAAPGLVFLPS